MDEGWVKQREAHCIRVNVDALMVRMGTYSSGRRQTGLIKSMVEELQTEAKAEKCGDTLWSTRCGSFWRFSCRSSVAKRCKRDLRTSGCMQP